MVPDTMLISATAPARSRLRHSLALCARCFDVLANAEPIDAGKGSATIFSAGPSPLGSRSSGPRRLTPRFQVTALVRQIIQRLIIVNRIDDVDFDGTVCRRECAKCFVDECRGRAWPPTTVLLLRV